MKTLAIQNKRNLSLWRGSKLSWNTLLRTSTANVGLVGIITHPPCTC